jgi:hypothetical protein
MSLKILSVRLAGAMNVAECWHMKHRRMLGRSTRTQGEVAAPYSTTRGTPEKSNAESAEIPERAPSLVSRAIRIALDFVILHLQALSCYTRDENKTLLVLPYFSARSPSRYALRLAFVAG